ncbi:MAG TPA: Spy/CpxP family protein refolding chaperone [Steroidobacteraceae bacterium]|jgi:Spy/CpxP family protein refolding chaperone
MKAPVVERAWKEKTVVRMRMVSWTGWLLAAFLACMGVAMAGDSAGGGWHGHGPGGDPLFGMFGPGLMGRMGDQLGLSSEQRQSIKGMLDAAKPGMQSLHESMRTNAEKLRSVQPDDPNYATVVAQVSQAAGELASRMVTEASQLRTQVYGVLNKEQKAKLPQLQAQMQEQARERFQRHRSQPAAPSTDSSPST